MHLLQRFALCSTLLVALTACGGSPQEETMKSTMSVMDKMASALEKVSSPETAKEAVSKIKALAPELKKLIEAGNALEEPTKELNDKYEPQMKELRNRLMAAMAKLANYPEQAQEIFEEMPKIDMK